MHGAVQIESGIFVDKVDGIIQIVGDIEYDMASKFRRHLNALARMHVNITVEINSHGGCIESGLMIIDSIKGCKSKITTRATGYAMSMAAVILAASPNREALEHASIMIHDGEYELSGKISELGYEASKIKKLDKITWDILDKCTGNEKGYWKTRCNGKDLALTAKQALREGLIDRICK